ncbi:AAA family ATPase [Schinkia azotoformans]|uniref:AAA family ATPase n=1 Tax=Schinkia azotoformans TaxID=1454 RepID=UPI002E1E2726|nr:AAA family ATPase [Schinkia azotoformans]
MRFNYLNLRAFGHFTDYEIHFDPSKNFHLIYGLNEAGKSTALRSINHFLFGFPQQTLDAFLHGNTKLRIEGELQNTEGETVRYIRRKGKKNTIIDTNGNVLNESVIDGFLHGISDNHFTNMFALNHETLREGGESLLESGGNLGESLFSAASGISVLRKVFEDLEKKSADLYKKRGSTPELNKLLKEEKELRKEIAQYQLKVQDWKELERKYNNGKKEIESLIREVKILSSEREKLQRMKLTLPKIAKLRELRNKLLELGEVPALPDNIEELRKEMVQRLESAGKEKMKAEDEWEETKKELQEITIPEGLLEQAVLIDALYRELQSYQNNVKQAPMLEAERKLLEARVISFMKEIDSVHARLDHIEKYRLRLAKKEKIRELCKDKPLLDQALETNEKERREIESDLKAKEEEYFSFPVPPNIEELENVIDIVKRAGDIEESLKLRIIDNNQTEQLLEEMVKQLPLWSGTYKELVEISVPVLAETIKKYEQEHTEILKNLEKTDEQFIIQTESISNYEEQIHHLEALTEIPSEDKLLSIRSHRDQGWKFIRTKLERGDLDEQAFNEFTNGKKIESVYENLVTDADAVADKMRSEAEKVGAKKKHLDDIKRCKDKIIELEQKKDELIKELADWQKSWDKLWESTSIKPLSPEEMREWVVKYGQIKGMFHDYEKEQKAIRELENKIAQYKQLLITVLASLVDVDQQKTLAELLQMAEKQQRKVNEDWNKRTRLDDSISGIKHRINNLSFKNKELYQKLENWKDQWLEAINGTNITDTTSVVVAEKIVHMYEECTKAYDELNGVEKKHNSILEQIAHYEERVHNLLKSTSLSYNEKAVDIVVSELNAKLGQAKEDKVRSKELSNHIKRLERAIREAVLEIDAAENYLNDLMMQAKCSSIEELEKVEVKFIGKKDYENRIRTLEEELIDIGGGLSLHEITIEVDQFDRDSIDVELEEINRKLSEIEPVRSELEQSHGVIKKEFEEKIQGNNTSSVLAEQKKESMHAKLADLTDQYIQIKLASTLLQKGIEYYRNQNQDPILKRASELFERLTLQSFSELIVDYNEKDQRVLMGVRDNGEKISIDGMSDGTIDQLYLSLRIASIEKYGNENEPIPFIVDDILVHFDDVRSKETLKILLELSKETQIIFFTHHSRLVEIMKELATQDQFQLIELNSKEAVNV